MSIAFACLHSAGCTHRELFAIAKSGIIPTQLLAEKTWDTLRQAQISDEKIGKIRAFFTKTTPEQIAQRLDRVGAQVVCWDDPVYPTGLSHLKHKPFLLYVRGTLRNDLSYLAVVGSRKISSYASNNVATMLNPMLSTRQWGIVSGGAYGVDILAHQYTLQRGGYTAVFFGAGIDIIYPAAHRGLFESIVLSGGVLVSAFPVGMRPEPFYFPIRNELIVGMSRGVLVMEAGEKSGTLTTARLALENDRDVFVVPGNISDSHFIGSNKLIRDGLGKIVLCGQDILDEYTSSFAPTQFDFTDANVSSIVFDTQYEKSIYQLLQTRPCDVSYICDTCALNVAQVSQVLLDFQMRGYADMDNTGQYRAL